MRCGVECGLDSLLAGCSGCVHSHETKDDAAAVTAKSKQGSVFAWFERSGWLIVATAARAYFELALCSLALSVFTGKAPPKTDAATAP